MAQAREHARTDHGFDEIPAELADRARGMIQDVQAAG